MKQILSLVACLFALQGYSQNQHCDLNIETDRLANIKTAQTPSISIINGANNISLNFWRTGGSVIFSAIVAGSSSFCIDEHSEVLLVFTNQAQASIKSTRPGNCTGSMQSLLSSETAGNAIQLLASANIATLRISTKNHVADFAITPGQANQVRTYFNCIREAAL